LFVVFAGKKQPKQVGKCQKFEKKINSEVTTTCFGKTSAKCTEFAVSVSNFRSRSRDFWWSLGFEVLTRFRSRLHHCKHIRKMSGVIH